MLIMNRNIVKLYARLCLQLCSLAALRGFLVSACILLFVSVKAQIISYESEYGSLSGSASIQNCGDCSAGKQVRSIEFGNFVTNTVYASYEGDYLMKLSFSSGDARSIFISVNDNEASKVVCYSGDWGVVWVKDVKLTLKAGANTIRFFNEGVFGSNLDRFTLERILNPIPSYEAEAGTLTGNAQIQECSACSGGNQVDNIGAASGVVESNVSVGEAGRYKMYVNYSSGDPRSLFISVNQGAAIEFVGYTGVWSVMGTKEVSISLNSGVNTIRFFNETGFAPNLDG